MTVTATLDQAIQSLRSLPADEQRHVSEQLIAYVRKFREFQAAIKHGSEQLERGEVVEINDVDHVIETIARKHGKA